ncbi:MAG: DUF4139 domain-containing protein [Chitinophagaceae bacterium]|nr:DUF4139 domain-containing protein [Chitinophagaceae bacterium]
MSTGTPNFGVTAPVLTPWYLQLYVPGLYTDLQRRAAQGNASRNMIQSYRDDKSLSEVVTMDAAGEYKQEKLKDKNIDPSTLQQYTTLNEGQLNTNFEIDLPYDIESDGQLHSVTIKDQEIACVLKIMQCHVWIKKLTCWPKWPIGKTWICSRGMPIS